MSDAEKDTTTDATASPATPFHDLADYVAMPRLSGLAISRDGTRLVTTVETPNPKGTGYLAALWEVDPTGERPAHRLTRSANGESGAAFTVTGDLYFTSARPDPERADGAGGNGADEPTSALWVLPAAGGEARVAVSRRGGIGSVVTAHDADVTLATASLMPGADGEETDEAIRKARKEQGVAAILHDSYPVRFWDADLGPAQPHVHAVEGDTLRDLTPDVGRRLERQTPVISPDGTFALVGLSRPMPGADERQVLARIEIATGERHILLDDEEHDFAPGPISPDSRRAVVERSTRSTPERAPRPTMAILDLASGELTDLAPEWDRWPTPMAWLPDGSGILAVADEDGRGPVFRVAIPSGGQHGPSGKVSQLTRDDATYSALVVAPDGSAAYAVRSSYAFPPEVVRIDLATGRVIRLPNPTERPELPGRLEEVETVASDGTRVRSWLALPDGAGARAPAPLLLWIHGGPLSSWNAWSWRWNPWLLVAEGYAVLLPDPALSTGYGQDFVQRGWGRWGFEPFTDLMAATDAAVERDDIDAGRTAAMGGSFGGYMANWVAGHTDRFRAIVTHASLWSLDQFGPTTDMSNHWAHEMTPDMAAANSPHLSVGDISTPMLVIHGDRDYRVPIGEGLRLWYDLLSKSGLPADGDGHTAHRFLYFPDENHWVLTPQHAKVWYGVVQHFLATHLDGKVPELPEELGR